VKIIGVEELLKTAKKDNRARKPLLRWIADASAADWKSPSDVKAAYASASFLADNRVVFNIGGNNFRLIVVAVYEDGALVVRFFGTHAEYDEIDANTV